MTTFQAKGCGIALTGDEHKVSVTGLAFCIIGLDWHSADWLTAFASPYPAAPDFPLCRGQNKTPRNTLFINGSTVSTGYSATVEVLHRTSKWGEVRRLACPLRRFPFVAPPNCGGKVVAPATKGGMHFPRPQGGCMVFRRAKPGCPVFAAKGGIKNGTHKGTHLASAAILHPSRGREPSTCL